MGQNKQYHAQYGKWGTPRKLVNCPNVSTHYGHTHHRILISLLVRFILYPVLNQPYRVHCYNIEPNLSLQMYPLRLVVDHLRLLHALEGVAPSPDQVQLAVR